jgi:hypothetical protein
MIFSGFMWFSLAKVGQQPNLLDTMILCFSFLLLLSLYLDFLTLFKHGLFSAVFTLGFFSAGCFQ